MQGRVSAARRRLRDFRLRPPGEKRFSGRRKQLSRSALTLSDLPCPSPCPTAGPSLENGKWIRGKLFPIEEGGAGSRPVHPRKSSPDSLPYSDCMIVRCTVYSLGDHFSCFSFLFLTLYHVHS